ncbi:uncharacterized mitochondrial protein-like protein [Tanacetum coccineum]|uniref:Uncharacterized mitochondrial protein-like protein n=1 Tax=Tanacetum coccineum TaxID=301880 RepID=A0ABQ5BPU1_9ASTR
MLVNHHLSILEEKYLLMHLLSLMLIYPLIQICLIGDASEISQNDGLFNGAYDDDEDVGAVADFNNMDNTIDFKQEGKIQMAFFTQQALELEAIRLFLAFASYIGFIVYQMDVKSAFLYGTIKEEVYVHQPPCFVDPTHPNKVYKVIKALYGLHQAPRAWPDIMFVVCACARFQVTPKASHLNAVKRIFRYLKHQPKLGLWVSRGVSPFELEAYSDSDYGGASLDRKSTTGGCLFLGGRLISWQCKKQTIVANSTTKAEYVAAANCCGQVYLDKEESNDGIMGFNFM